MATAAGSSASTALPGERSDDDTDDSDRRRSPLRPVTESVKEMVRKEEPTPASLTDVGLNGAAKSGV